MANDNEIQIPISFETDGAQKQLGDFEKSVAGKAEGIGTTLAGIGTALTAAFAALGAVKFFEKAIEEAAQAETEVAKLNFAIAATGEFSQQASDHLQDFASNIQKTTQFSDDAALQALTLAKNFGLTNDKAEELVKTASNLAAQTGDTLPNATSRLLDSLNGQTRALKDLGPQYKNLTEEQSKAGAGVALVAKQFDGAAAVLTGTFNGALAQAQNNFADIFKEFGKGIVQNQTVVQSINLVSKAFSFLADQFLDNKQAVSDFVTASVKVLAQFVKFSVDGVQLVTEGYLFLAEGIGRAAGVIKAGFQAITGHVDEAKASFQEALTTGNDFTKSVVGIRTGLDKFVNVVEVTANSIGQVTTSAKKSDEQFQKLSDSVQKSGIAFGKSREEALKFAEELNKSNANEFEQAALLRDKESKQIDKFVKENALTRQEGLDLQFVSEQKFETKLKDLKEKAGKAEDERLKKQAEDRKALVEKAVASPVQILVDQINIKPAVLTDFEATAAAGAVSIMGSILNGAAGAKNLVAAGAGAFADAFIPGIGGVVQGIISKFAEGPDAVKQFVREFVDALPDIIQNIAEGAPAFVEAFVDSMVNKGGAVKIGIAIAVAMSGYPVLKALGKQIGADMAETLRVAVVGTIAGALAAPIVAAFALLPANIRQSISDGATQFAAKVRDAFANIIPSLGAALNSVFTSGAQVIVNAFTGGAQLVLNAVTGGFSAGIQGILNAFSSVFGGLSNAISSAFSGSINAFYDAIKRMGDVIRDAFGDSIRYLEHIIRDSIGDSANYMRDQIAKPFNRVIDFFNNFTLKVDVPGVGGGGGGNIHILGADTGFHFASGGISGKIPQGFSNDSFPIPFARFNSGELIVPTDTTERLDSFLRNAQAPKQSAAVDINTTLLNRIANLLAQPLDVRTTAQVNNKAFADIILSLNRSNARLAV